MTIKELQALAHSYIGKLKEIVPRHYDKDVVAVVEYRDSTMLD